MLHLLGLVLSFGLADGINPTSIGPALYLASEPCPRRSVLQFAAGYSAALLIGGLLLTLGPGRLVLALVPKPDATTRYILETIAGAAMLAVAAYLWWRRERLANLAPAADSQRTRRSPALLGAAISAAELPTAFPYLAAIVAIVGSGINLGEQIVLVVIYDACFILPVLAIAAALAIAGDRAIDRLVRIRESGHRRWPQVVAVVALVAGVYVITIGITGLELRAHGAVGTVSRGLRHILAR
jgi:cytochrome c biogenesis protein CcdA